MLESVLLVLLQLFVDIRFVILDHTFDLLKHDKKNSNGQVNFVLLNDFEDFKLDCKISNELLKESIEFYNS